MRCKHSDCFDLHLVLHCNRPFRNNKPPYSGGLISEYTRSATTRARLVGSQEVLQALLPGLLQHGQVAAVDDLQTQRARLAHQIPVAPAARS